MTLVQILEEAEVQLLVEVVEEAVDWEECLEEGQAETAETQAAQTAEDQADLEECLEEDQVEIPLEVREVEVVDMEALAEMEETVDMEEIADMEVEVVAEVTVLEPWWMVDLITTLDHSS